MVRNGEFCSQIQGDPDDADHDQRMAVPLRVLSGACLDQNFWKKNPAGTQSHGEKMVKKDNFPFWIGCDLWGSICFPLPNKNHMAPENTPFRKGETFTNHHFWDSMLIFGEGNFQGFVLSLKRHEATGSSPSFDVRLRQLLANEARSRQRRRQREEEEEALLFWVVATQIFFIFTPKIGEDSHFDIFWRAYFSKGLKPPSSSFFSVKASLKPTAKAPEDQWSEDD